MSFGRPADPFPVDKDYLQNSLNALSKAFVESLHSEHTQKMKAAMGVETWQRREPTTTHVEILKHLAKDSADATGLSIGGDTFPATQALLILLELVWSYLQAARKIPKVANDIATKFVETVKYFALQGFDLVVKCQAVQTGQVKSVTTKMLAIFGSGLEFLNRLLRFISPRLQTQFASADKINGLFGELHKILAAHCQAALEKIADVLGTIITKAAAAPDVALDKVSPFTTQIASEILLLHKGIADCLPPNLLALIYKKIGDSLSAAFSRLQKGGKSKEGLQRDVAYLNEQLRACPCEVALA
jgi:hypothetical protein